MEAWMVIMFPKFYFLDGPLNLKLFFPSLLAWVSFLAAHNPLLSGLAQPLSPGFLNLSPRNIVGTQSVLYLSQLLAALPRT